MNLANYLIEYENSIVCFVFSSVLVQFVHSYMRCSVAIILYWYMMYNVLSEDVQ